MAVTVNARHKCVFIHSGGPAAKIRAREVGSDIVFRPSASALKRAKHASMRPSARSFLRATQGTVKPSSAAALWFVLARLVSCIVLAIVLSFIVAPGEAQAHGIHGSAEVTVAIATTDDLAKAETLGSGETSALKCLICCTSSGCVAAFIPATFDLSGAEEAKTGFQTASSVAVYQMAPHGLRRPPRQIS